MLTLLGRRSHEASPNTKGRLRLVMSRSVPDLQRRADAWWWNPAAVSLEEALHATVPEGGEVGVPGGQSVFDLLGPGAFSAFHLARAHGRYLPGGRGLFRACEGGIAAEEILAAGGLAPAPTQWLDRPSRVALTVWRKAH